jgi:pimeloyl-ACP methyl ester carboxylesterase
MVRLPKNAETLLDGNPGTYSLRFYEHQGGLGAWLRKVDYSKLGHAILGPIVSVDSKTHVTRALVSVEAGDLHRGNVGWISGWLGTEPTHFAKNIELIQMDSSENWVLPAWFQPQQAHDRNEFDTWVIHVHGRGATAAETARNFAQFYDFGFSNLSIAFRNDGVAKRNGQPERGPLGLGTTEWLDLETAVAFASDRGANRILVMGWSYGAAITLQFARHSELADKVSGYIFDSPVISWRNTLEFQVALAGAPRSWARLGEGYLADRSNAASLGLKAPIDFEQFEPAEVAKHLKTPTLLLHSVDDGFIPIAPCQVLASELVTTVTLREFTRARHCKLFNYDAVGYRQAIADFVQRL